MLEIFEFEGKLVYREVEKRCFRHGGDTVEVNFAIRATDLPVLVAMSDGDCVLQFVDCSQCCFESKPLKQSYVVSEIDSLVVFENWQEDETPAIAVYERNADKEFVCTYLSSQTEEIPQCFWEIMYPSICVRIIAKVRMHFCFNGLEGVWYFVGKNTGILYAVTMDFVAPYSDAMRGDKAKELGISDGLKRDCFYEVDVSGDCFSFFSIKALEDINYPDRRIVYPENLVALVHNSANIEAELRGLLTEDEFSLIWEY